MAFEYAFVPRGMPGHIGHVLPPDAAWRRVGRTQAQRLAAGEDLRAGGNPVLGGPHSRRRPSLDSSNEGAHLLLPQDRFNVCVWPANIEVRDSGNPFFAPGFHGNLWVSNDPAFDYVIVRPYMCAEVAATCIGHDDRALASPAAIARSCPVCDLPDPSAAGSCRSTMVVAIGPIDLPRIVDGISAMRDVALRWELRIARAL